jgi:hypothetical protein
MKFKEILELDNKHFWQRYGRGAVGRARRRREKLKDKKRREREALLKEAKELAENDISKRN